MELGLPEILIVLVVVLLLFGPSKLPQLGESLGRAIRDFREAASGRTERSGEAPPTQDAGSAPALPSADLAPQHRDKPGT
jgi:sec-independent protein translocase protein TatA